jgi:hypothetical protein
MMDDFLEIKYKVRFQFHVKWDTYWTVMDENETHPIPSVDSVHRLTAWSRVLLKKLPVVQLLKNFPTFYGTQRFITCSQEPDTGP